MRGLFVRLPSAATRVWSALNLYRTYPCVVSFPRRRESTIPIGAGRFE
jgi:hypothetical protein